MANIKNYISEIVETIQAYQVETDSNGSAWASMDELQNSGTWQVLQSEKAGYIDMYELAEILPEFGYELFIEREPAHIGGYWYMFEYVRVQEL